jgi:hypothetical protein
MTQASPEPQVVEIEFELQLSDVHRGLAVLPRARLSKWVGWAGVLAVLGIIGWRWHEGRDPRILAIIGIVLISFFILGRDPTRRIAKRIFDALPAESRQVKIRFDEAGVQVDSNDAQSLGWSNVTRVLDSRETFMIFASRTNAQIIPKRAMTPEQIRAIRGLVARRVVTQREPWLTPALVRRVLIYTLIVAAIALYMVRQNH